MNKALEALRELGMQTVYDEEGYEEPVEVYLKEHYYTLMKLLLPPTEQQLCEALSKHHGGENVVYENGNFYVVGDSWREVIVVSMKDNNGNYVIDFCGDTFPPHLVIMIGRFYEGGGELK